MLPSLPLLSLPLLPLLLLLLNPTPTHALSNWYTPPGGPPTGGVKGDKIRGVNLGGWFVLENWMMPSLLNNAPFNGTSLTGQSTSLIPIPDEWTYCSVLGPTECLSRLKTHWNTWITEDDFRRMADYGLNTVRIPVGHWMFESSNVSSSTTTTAITEPYISDGSQLVYLEKALNWAGEYGLDVIMDLHTVPGSQNGQDNSGRYGDVEFFWNTTNLQRAVGVVGEMVKWSTEDRFEGTVKGFELLNEPYIEAYKAGTIPWDFLVQFYVEAYAAVRANEYVQPGDNESMVILHDAFQPLANWNYFFSTNGSTWTNYAMDTHIYQAFSGAKDDQGYVDSTCYQSQAISAAQAANFPVIVGEWSLGTATACVDYTDCWNWSLQQAVSNITASGDDVNTFMREFWEVQSDVFELGTGWIFWNWKTERAPAWSYEQSVAQEWIPVDPTEKIYSFDSSASYSCLSNLNYSDIPAYPSNAISSIPAGTHSPVRQAAVSMTMNSTSMATATGAMTSTSMSATTMTASRSTGSAAATSTRTSSASSSMERPSAFVFWLTGIVGSAVLALRAI